MLPAKLPEPAQVGLEHPSRRGIVGVEVIEDGPALEQVAADPARAPPQLLVPGQPAAHPRQQQAQLGHQLRAQEEVAGVERGAGAGPRRAIIGAARRELALDSPRLERPMDDPLGLTLAFLGKVASVWRSPQVAGSVLAALAALLVAVAPALRPRLDEAGDDARRPHRRRLRRFYLGGIYAFLVSGPALPAAHRRSWTPTRPSCASGCWPTSRSARQFFVASVVMDGVLYWTHRADAREPGALGVPQRASLAAGDDRARQLPLPRRRRVRARAGPVRPRACCWACRSTIWLPTVWIQVALDCLAHSGLGLGLRARWARVLVSPRFHRVHHSADPAHSDRNFGMTYSFWDRAVRDLGRATRRSPLAYGVPGLALPDSFLRQLAHPFVALAGAASAAGSRARRPCPHPRGHLMDELWDVASDPRRARRG